MSAATRSGTIDVGICAVQEDVPCDGIDELSLQTKAAQGHRIGFVISESRDERLVSGQEHAVDPGVWTLRFGSTIESRICTAHVVLAAHIAVSIALHTFISDLVQQVFQKTFTIRPRNKMSRRCRQGTACGCGDGWTEKGSGGQARLRAAFSKLDKLLIWRFRAGAAATARQGCVRSCSRNYRGAIDQKAMARGHVSSSSS